MNKLLLSFLILLSPLAAIGGEFLGSHVVAVVDGDTLLVDVPPRGQLTVRLAWIAAPARLQEAGEAARSSLGMLASGREVRLERVGEGRGGAWTAVVWSVPGNASCRSADCPEPLDLGLAQVGRGLAWHDRRSLGQPAPALAQYRQAEFEAKIHRLGLWAGKNPVPPWDWRAR